MTPEEAAAPEIGQWLVPEITLDRGGPRSALLIKQAYEEEGLACPTIDERVSATKLLFPRSYVERVAMMPGRKDYDYSFMGVLYRPDTFANRSWIVDFAKRRFTPRSYLLITDAGTEYEPLGPFDRTRVDRDVFVPKQVPPPDRGRFHEPYFRVLRASEFALCPAGDSPWSQRFFEAIMCRALPIVSDRDHVGRNALERSIGYKVFLPDDHHVYDRQTADENFRLFIQHQTLIARVEESTT
jgi:hypothetical protein